MNEKVRAYLDRIGYQGGTEPTAETLSALQYAHLITVPYENLDILRGRRIRLDLDHLYEKIVVRRRGGYCFELNKLFGWLLRELGYQVTDYVARYWRGETEIPTRRHQVLSVVVPGTKEEYLCDVGVGAVIPLYPLPIRFGEEFDQNGPVYAFREDERFGIMLIERHDGGWRDVYSFTREVQYEPDFMFASFWCEFAEDSIFNKAPMLSIRKEGQIRCTLDGNVYRMFSPEGVTEKTLAENEVQQVIRDVFGIYLDE